MKLLPLLVMAVTAFAQNAPVTNTVGLTMDAGRYVNLISEQKISTAKAHSGQDLKFHLRERLVFQNYILAEAGTPVTAYVKDITKPGFGMRDAELWIEIKDLPLTDGSHLPFGEVHLNGVDSDFSAGEAAKTVGKMMVMSVFARGVNVVINKGGMVRAIVGKGFIQDPSRFKVLSNDGNGEAHVTIFQLGSKLNHDVDIYCGAVKIPEAGHVSEPVTARVPAGHYTFSVAGGNEIDVELSTGDEAYISLGLERGRKRPQLQIETQRGFMKKQKQETTIRKVSLMDADRVLLYSTPN